MTFSLFVQFVSIFARPLFCRWNAAKEGWKCNQEPPPRKDFALFVKIQIIGSNNGFTEKCSSKSGKVLLFIICGLQSVPKPTSVKASEKLYKICFLIK